MSLLSEVVARMEEGVATYMKYYCLCKEEGTEMKYSRSASLYYCPECANMISHGVIEDIIKPLMKNVSCLRLPVLKKEILVKKG